MVTREGWETRKTPSLSPYWSDQFKVNKPREISHFLLPIIKVGSGSRGMFAKGSCLVPPGQLSRSSERKPSLGRPTSVPFHPEFRLSCSRSCTEAELVTHNLIPTDSRCLKDFASSALGSCLNFPSTVLSAPKFHTTPSPLSCKNGFSFRGLWVPRWTSLSGGLLSPFRLTSPDS